MFVTGVGDGITMSPTSVMLHQCNITVTWVKFTRWGRKPRTGDRSEGIFYTNLRFVSYEAMVENGRS